MSMCALGETLAAAFAKSRTIEAFVLKRSSLVMPGLRGTPAGITMISAPSKAFSSPPSGPSGEYPVVCQEHLHQKVCFPTLDYLYTAHNGRSIDV